MPSLTTYQLSPGSQGLGLSTTYRCITAHLPCGVAISRHNLANNMGDQLNRHITETLVIFVFWKFGVLYVSCHPLHNNIVEHPSL